MHVVSDERNAYKNLKRFSVNVRISARGAYLISTARGGTNSKGGAYLKGALISFINF